jgi:hypothetical protein
MGPSEPAIVYDLEDSVARVCLKRPQKRDPFAFEMKMRCAPRWRKARKGEPA